MTILVTPAQADTPPNVSGTETSLAWIRLSDDGTQFVSDASGNRFVAWGFNYDHDTTGRLLEDYWVEDWFAVVEDFHEMKALGANVVRVHLQLARFMATPETPNPTALRQLTRLLELAETTGLYLDITGLGCYHKRDVPGWYDAMVESQRWEVQAIFWESVAHTCAWSNAVFCYDLMNEPILPGAHEQADGWLAGEFGGKHFVQRITLDLAGRTREQVAQAWVEKLVGAIRTQDARHLVTIGVIPWVYTFPQAQPLFYSPKIGELLDFVSVHFYPEKDQVDRALTALAAYDLGKPLVIEECFPLRCGMDAFDAFVEGSRKMVDGYVGFYWGKTREEYLQSNGDTASGLIVEWLDYFQAKHSEIQGESHDGR